MDLRCKYGSFWPWQIVISLCVPRRDFGVWGVVFEPLALMLTLLALRILVQ